MKYEWKKEEKYLYGVKQKIEIIDVPNQKFIMINGEGNPNETDFSDRVSILFTLAYGIKMLFKKMNTNENNSSYTDFTVFPLEGIWEKDSEEYFNKNKLKYTIMIKQPDFITRDIFELAIKNVKAKKPNKLYDEITFDIVEGGKAVQILHIGSFDTETYSFEKMETFIKKEGLLRKFDYHTEIYLNNKNRTLEENLKTILRYSIK
ncbi:GyrI-like domain-containing protein [Peptacetobacter sp.]|uniref:GyrI-like domain-containing protein n=1 Tax=Peptacetobacter sp. TaxID=2991975 RepID=UPI002622E6CE|nr:GyrI-like domain-containing protein [Peptacetobacter sp.]